MENDGIRLKYNWIWIVGLALLIIGGVLAVLMVLDYSSSHLSIRFTASSQIQDLGTLLGGTVGILFSLASIAFFVYTLIQTRHEIELQQQEMRDTRKVMEDQRDAFRLQTNITSFYNLLSNHREFCTSLRTDESEGFDYIDSVHSSITQDIERFKTGLRSGFEHVEYTRLQPRKFKRTHAEFFSSWIPNVLQIVEFIQKHLGVEYHKILFASLVEQERYLLGFVVHNRINDFSLEYAEDIGKYFGAIEYDYVRSYRESGGSCFEPNLDGYVPFLSFDLEGLIEEKVDRMDVAKIITSEAFSRMCVKIINESPEVGGIMVDQVEVEVKVKKKHISSHNPTYTNYSRKINIGKPLEDYCRFDIRPWLPEDWMSFLLRENQHFPSQRFDSEISLTFKLMNTNHKKAFKVNQKVYIDLDPVQSSAAYDLKYYRQG